MEVPLMHALRRSLTLATALLMLSASVAAAAPPAWPDTNPSADARARHTFVWIDAGDHQIPGILTLPKAGGAARSYPAVLMLHGFASHKDEVGDMYLREARELAERGIASLRIDFAGTGDSQQPYTDNTWTGMVADAVIAYDWLA
jgi:dipeptidyl aminopeptidase/acylaminoacyl peptidase